MHNTPLSPGFRSLRSLLALNSSRYFIAQNGKEFKWKVTPQRLEVRPIA